MSKLASFSTTSSEQLKRILQSRSLGRERVKFPRAARSSSDVHRLLASPMPDEKKATHAKKSRKILCYSGGEIDVTLKTTLVVGNLCGAKSATQSKNCYFSCKARSFHHRDVVVPSIPFPYLAKEKFAPWKLLESSAFPSFLLYVYWSHVTSRKTKLGALPIAATT